MNQDIKTLWIENYKINSLLVNAMGRLGLYGVLNLIQETAWIHAETLGFGMKAMEEKNLFWVVTRQTLKMTEWPAFGKTVQVQTWLRPPEGALVAREFRILDENGKDIGACVTSWLALDRQTKRVLPAQDLYPWSQIARPETTGLVADKIPVEGTYETLAKFGVRNSDLDTNQHVNNTKYSQWILDSIPYDLHRSLKLNSYSVNFLAETHLGDEVQVDRNCDYANGFATERGESYYRGLRSADQKVLFTAKLTWEKR
jgi:acyl-ACP thioesterase